MTEQLGLAARSPADGALKLSSAVITAGGSGPHDLERDHLRPWELSISAQVLGEIEIMLATTHRPGGSTEDTGAANRAGGHHELHVNSVLLSLLPDVIHLVPVNGDFEDGYGDTPEAVAATVESAVEHGLAGIGIEDTSDDPDRPIRDFDEAVDRVRFTVAAAKRRIVVTGRTDNFAGDLASATAGMGFDRIGELIAGAKN